MPAVAPTGRSTGADGMRVLSASYVNNAVRDAGLSGDGGLRIVGGAAAGVRPLRLVLQRGPRVGVFAISATVDASRTFISRSSVSKTGPFPA